MFDVIGIGNPLLDLTVSVTEEFLNKHSLIKGQMILIDKDTQTKILSDIDLKGISENPGGSVANALAAVNSLEGKSLFLGSIGKDFHGDIYEDLIEAAGIVSGLKKSSNPQGKCIVLITPDGQRTLVTYLGACLDFNKDSLDLNAIKNSKILHIEGFQFDSENQTEAILLAMKTAKENNVLISMDLSDVGVIQRHREILQSTVKDFVDIIFANELEAEEFTGKLPNEAVKELASICKIAIVKIGSKGSLIMSDKILFVINGFDVKIINTNGAGDTFAGSFLKSYINGKTLDEAGKIASYLAAQIVSSKSSRLEKNMVQEVDALLSK